MARLNAHVSEDARRRRRHNVEARLIDELHVAISPVLLGSGEQLLANIDTPALGYLCTEHVATPIATHFVLRRSA
jgi:dihydrofolate reductase